MFLGIHPEPGRDARYPFPEITKCTIKSLTGIRLTDSLMPVFVMDRGQHRNQGKGKTTIP